MTTTKIDTAWFGSEHPAKNRACPDCHAAAGSPCTNTLGLCGLGTTGARLLGMHAARIRGAE